MSAAGAEPKDAAHARGDGINGHASTFRETQPARTIASLNDDQLE
jgi:hypothetical protein